MRVLVLVDDDRIALAGLHAAVCQAAAAQVGDHIAGFRTFVAGNIDDLHDMVVVLAAADGQAHSFGHYGSVFVNAASLRRLVLGDHVAGDLVELRKDVVALPGLHCDLSEHLIFCFLHTVIEQLQVNSSFSLAGARAHGMFCAAEAAPGRTVCFALPKRRPAGCIQYYIAALLYHFSAAPSRGNQRQAVTASPLPDRLNFFV